MHKFALSSLGVWGLSKADKEEGKLPFLGGKTDASIMRKQSDTG